VRQRHTLTYTHAWHTHTLWPNRPIDIHPDPRATNDPVIHQAEHHQCYHIKYLTCKGGTEEVLYGAGQPVWVNTSVSEYQCGWIPMWVNSSVSEYQCERIPVWVNTSVGEYQCGRIPVWANTSVGEYQCGRIPVWANTSVGEYQCGVNTSVGEYQCEWILVLWLYVMNGEHYELLTGHKMTGQSAEYASQKNQREEQKLWCWHAHIHSPQLVSPNGKTSRFLLPIFYWVCYLSDHILRQRIKNELFFKNYAQTCTCKRTHPHTNTHTHTHTTHTGIILQLF
jgi:hypothetical protein